MSYRKKLFETVAASAAGLIPPESAHHIALAVIASPFFRAMAGFRTKNTANRDIPRDVDLSTFLPHSGLRFANPLGLAAGFDKNCQLAEPMLAHGFGFVECGTVTPLPQKGNPRPRLFRLRPDRAVINRMGFNNAGMLAFSNRLHALPAALRPLIGVNIGPNRTSPCRLDDYITGIPIFSPLCGYLVLNISSPNTPGLADFQNSDELDALLGRTDEAIKAMPASDRAPVFLKISPDIGRAVLDRLIASAIASPSVRGLIVSNTLSGRTAGLHSRHADESGGLSGAPIFSRTTALLMDVARLCEGRLDLIGVGGVENARSAYAKLRAGGHAIQMYTGFAYQGAGLVPRLLQELAALMRADGVRSIAEIIGVDLA